MENEQRNFMLRQKGINIGRTWQIIFQGIVRQQVSTMMNVLGIDKMSFGSI